MRQAAVGQRGEQRRERGVAKERGNDRGGCTLSMLPSTCNISQYSHIFSFMCDLLGFYWSCNNKRNLRCSMLHTHTGYTPLYTLPCSHTPTFSTLPSAPPPLFHFATRHFLWLISLIACGLRKLVKIFLLAPKLPLPPTLPRPLLLLQLPPSKCAPKYAMLFATLT